MDLRVLNFFHWTLVIFEPFIDLTGIRSILKHGQLADAWNFFETLEVAGCCC
jgi:hypothetical protein